MYREAKRGRLASVRPLLVCLGLAAAAFAAAGEARAEPPIKSPQDAYCRAEARARVFSVQDPQNLGLQEVGRRLYYGCMRKFSGGSRRKHRHRHRHRR